MLNAYLQHSSSLIFTGLSRCILLGALSVAAPAWSQSAPSSASGVQAQQALTLTPCWVPGLSRGVKCGKLMRPESADGTRQIPIHFVIVPSQAQRKDPDPLIVFAGGPGQSGIKLAPTVNLMFSQLNKRRDIILFDQRGTGQSNPLDCGPPPAKFASLQQNLDQDENIKKILACANAKADTRAYTTTIAMRDVDAIVQALGYDKVNLWGGSYGTRAAIEYVRQFESRVRTVVLDSVAPADLILPVSVTTDGDKALEDVIKRCEADARCKATYPQMREKVNAFMLKAKAGNQQITVRHPQTGSPETITLTPDVLTGMVRGPLYFPTVASLLPSMIAQAAQGRFEPLVASATGTSSQISGQMNMGMHLAVVCAEDLPLIKPEHITAATNTRFGTVFIDSYKKMCTGWNVGKVDPAFYAPPTFKVPTLILSGGADPVTPPKYGDQIGKTLPNHKHLVAPNIGHMVTPTVCGTQLVTDFVRAGNTAKLDGACLAAIPAPPFILPPGQTQ